jgi:TSCPD domain
MTNKSERPDLIDGHIKKVKVGCGTLFIPIGIEKGKITEIFLNGSKLGGCRANQEGIGRLLSLAFRHDIPIEEIIDQLQLIVCPACTRVKAKLSDPEKIRDFPTSCPDAVAKLLQTVVDANKPDKKKE